MANSPLKFMNFVAGQGSMMSQVMKQFQESRKDPFKQAKEAPRQKVGFGGPQTAINTQPTITPQPDMTPKTKMPSNMNSMTTNMTDDKMPMEDEVMESNQGNNVGLTNTGSGSSAVADGPRGNNYSDLVSGSGAMDKIKDNTSTPFKMKESPFPMDDLSGDDKITKKDVLIGRGVIDIKDNKIED